MILQLPDGATVGKAALRGDRWAWDFIHGALNASRSIGCQAARTSYTRGGYELWRDAEAVTTFATRALGYIEGQVRMLPTIAGQLA